VLAGRDDPRQKGYDVAAAAAAAFLQTPGNDTKAQFLFFPIPGDEGREGLLFLRELADAYPANVLVLPFLFREAMSRRFRAARSGSCRLFASRSAWRTNST
jgi:hypothetical protein